MKCKTGSTVSDPQHDTNPQNKPERYGPAKDPPSSQRVSHRGLSVPAFRRRCAESWQRSGCTTGPAGRFIGSRQHLELWPVLVVGRPRVATSPDQLGCPPEHRQRRGHLSPRPEELTVERIGELLPALDARLGGMVVPVELLVVGGAAVAMQWNPRRSTYDVDVVNVGIPQMLWDAVAAVAEAGGLGVHWLNDAAKVAVPTGTVPGSPSLLYQGSNLAVYGASVHMVMAMKLRSG